MAYQFCDSFDNYNAQAELWEVGSGSAFVYSSAYARFPPPSGCPGQGVKWITGASIRKNMQSSQATFIIKIAVNLSSYGGASGSGNPFLCVLNSSVVQWYLNVTSSGALVIYSSSQQAITAINLISLNQWYGIEIEVTVGSGSGIANIWVNGTQVLAATGLSTGSAGSGNQVEIGDILDEGIAGMADDLRVWDNTGSSQNAPLGTDSRLITKLPSAAGAFAQFSPNGAATNWQCVSDNPPDGDTTYVSGSSAGLTDAYTMPAAGFSAVPAMTVARSYVRKDDGATRSLDIGVLNAGTPVVGSNIVVGSSYAFVDSCVNIPSLTALTADALQHYKQETA